ncbi:MAG: type 1 glutamine amidotransferase [Candidatus Bathyarchaeota archaeon]|nr:type 1 glutamine amidotransferase [Candidatus Bathyarchaeum tardum]WGM90275.1 MAG: type 1 glutamine amidotransferase [Candidatus Bathyarchaeum tardum]WNZ29637.1 MAG: type 1 glutamine amidotransferase [Candidatus Bathyarchaeota archaeon]
MEKRKRVIIFLENGFEDSEFVYPYYRFQEAEFNVDIVAPLANKEYVGKHGLTFKSNLAPEQVNIDDYSGLIIPGGFAPDRLRINKQIVNLIQQANKKSKIIAAICHGPQLLIEAKIVKGKKMTSYVSVSTDLKNAGAIFLDEPVVKDHNIITSRHPRDLPQFCKATIEALT